MSMDLRDGLRELAQPVTRGVCFEALSRKVRRRRAQRMTGLALALSVGAGTTTWLTVQDHERQPTQLAADGPSTVDLPEFVQDTLRRVQHIDVQQGTRLSTYPYGNTKVITAGVVGDGETCTFSFREDGATPMRMSGIACETPGLQPVNQLSAGDDIWGSPDGGGSVAMLRGIAPSGTRSIEIILEPNGHKTTLDVYDSGEQWGHVSYFALPWFAAPTTVRAFDAQTQQVACVRQSIVNGRSHQVPC